MSDILVPISPGELLDKITILRIKAARILDAAKLANVKLELALLEATWRDSGCAAQARAADEHALQQVNEQLWDIEDRIRDKEAKQRRSRSASMRSSARASSRKNPTSSTARRRGPRRFSLPAPTVYRARSK